MNSTQPPPGAVQSVQVLRGLAAMMVIFSHVIDNFASATALGENGDILTFGVDLFFVISGFIMVHSTSNRKITARQFMLARITRIVPLYWLALLATFVLLALTGGRLPAEVELLQAALFIPYLDPGSGAFLPFLPVGWTLNYEMLFYLLFAATIAIGGLRQLLAISIIFVLLVVCRIVFDPQTAIGFRFTSPLFLEFTMGMAVALIWQRARASWRPLSGLGLLAAGVIGLFVLHPLHADFGLPRFVAHGGPATLVVAGALLLEPWFQTRILRPFRALGDASYSLYLGHALPLIFVPGLLPATWDIWIRASLMTGVCVLFGIASYRLVERPVQVTLRAWTKAKPGRVLTV
ncbi:MAG: acyltransferase [Alphaproteobacteria bacterium]|nr:acyltransferase [Alphaproteobacteria bacterium]